MIEVLSFQECRGGIIPDDPCICAPALCHEVRMDCPCPIAEFRREFSSHIAYGLRTHNRQMTVIDLVHLVQRHPGNLDAPLAYAVNCFQALNVCARTLRLYSIDYTYPWPEQEDLSTINEILDLLSRPAPTGAGLPNTIVRLLRTINSGSGGLLLGEQGFSDVEPVDRGHESRY